MRKMPGFADACAPADPCTASALPSTARWDSCAKAPSLQASQECAFGSLKRCARLRAHLHSVSRSRCAEKDPSARDPQSATAGIMGMDLPTPPDRGGGTGLVHLLHWFSSGHDL